MYEPTERVRFTTSKGRDLTGVIEMRGDVFAMVKIDKSGLHLLIDMGRIIGRVTG